jgi:Yippee zinc-binding/DNA-binding /Mis18, centromere assembly
VTCATDIAFASQIVSKGFTGRHGRAYLVSPPGISEGNKDRKSTKLVNIKIGRPVNRELLTGAHVVADVSCIICSSVLGWRYLDAKEQTQKYKIGKYILESKKVVGAVSWEDGVEGLEVSEPAGGVGREDEELVIFDDEDEDECEDLFSGTWNPSVVASRRAMRVNTRVTDTGN